MVQSVIMRNFTQNEEHRLKNNPNWNKKHWNFYTYVRIIRSVYCIIGATFYIRKWSQNWKRKSANAFGISTLSYATTTIVMFDIWFEETAMIICWEAKPCWHLTSAFPILSHNSQFYLSAGGGFVIWVMPIAHKRKKNVNFWCIMKFLRMEDIFCCMPLTFFWMFRMSFAAAIFKNKCTT